MVLGREELSTSSSERPQPHQLCSHGPHFPPWWLVPIEAVTEHFFIVPGAPGSTVTFMAVFSSGRAA